MITIELLAALYGDTLLIVIETAEDARSTTILIDCGYNYRNKLLPILKRYAAKGKAIDRFIITHYDDDHIRSAKTFIEENGDFENPRIIPISQVWLNAYRHLQFSKPRGPVTDKNETSRLKRFLADHAAEEAVEREISAAQASHLGKELFRLRYPWNVDYGGQAICVENAASVAVNDEVNITVLSPTKERLVALEKKFEEVLAKEGISLSDSDLIDDALELYLQSIDKGAELEDESEISASGRITSEGIRRMTKNAVYTPDNAPGNGSSIAFILEAGDKKLLLLADAHAEVVVEQLEKLYPDTSTYPIYFDAVKVSHHGSFRNNSPRLFEIIDSPIFMISTNGEHPSHDHPDTETIAHIINRPLSNGIEKRKIIFNYDLPHAKSFFEKAIMEEYKYEAIVENTILIND